MNRQYFEASAPGRLDVMGGIADYSGSLVLQMPIREETTVSMALRTDYQCVLESEIKDGGRFSASLDYRDLLKEGKVNLDFAREYFRVNKNISWSAYVLGCVLVLQQAYPIAFRGADWRISSDVPLGKGVSSSASLEVAALKALGKAFGISFEGTSLPRLGQQAENLVAGAPCGLMDQLTSFLGEPRKLLPIVCQPDHIDKPIAIPADISFVGIDSGIRHAVRGASYSDVRCAAFMGYTIIAASMGMSDTQLRERIRKGDNTSLPYGGYLSNIPVAEYERKLKRLLPESITGKEFLSRFGSTIDPVTRVASEVRYFVRQCTSHPVYENDRVRQFMDHLVRLNLPEENSARISSLARMGELMEGSHASYSRCGLGSDRTDEIVAAAKSKLNQGIMGAKITGGGSGGTVCLLIRGDEGRAAAKELHQYFVRKFGTLAFFES